MPQHPRIIASATAFPSQTYTQDTLCAFIQEHNLGAHWADSPATAARGAEIARLFASSRVQQRQSVIDIAAFYRGTRSTGERMAEYRTAGVDLGRAALAACLGEAIGPAAISDLVVVSCTGYCAPGLDILLARDLGLPADTRRVCVGHMGCFGALVGLRQALATVRAHPGATAAMLSVELCSLHFAPSDNLEVLTSFALFGDAAAAIVVRDDATATGPEIVDVYCAADFPAMDQMSWTITDEGFIMGLSPRVPVTLRRKIGGVVERLLAPHDLTVPDITHWLVHPGGPSILEAIAGKLELSDAQMAPAWRALGEHGNCSSATVLVMLDDLIRSGQARPGEWAVMMAFGPGLTLETCLLQF